MSEPSREAAIAVIQESLMTIARRGTARARRAGGLSSVDHSMLTYVGARPGARATDIAAHFGLNRSTVSRQIGHLADEGLVAYAEAEGRGHALAVTERGEAALAAARSDVGAGVTERLAGWSTDDVAEFARMLERYTADDGA